MSKSSARPKRLKSIPGNPAWHLAPIEMAWEGKSLGHICEQIKDPERNGGKTMDEIVEHMAHDSLVGWGWNPGAGREPVPGTPGRVRRTDRPLGGRRRGLPACMKEGDAGQDGVTTSILPVNARRVHNTLMTTAGATSEAKGR